MWKRTIAMGLLAAMLVTLVGAGMALAQEPERDRGGRRGPPRDPEEMRRRFEEFRQRMSERMREQLGATEDEWKILEPRIEKVREAQREMRGGGFRMTRGMFGRGRRGRGDDNDRGDRPERERSDIEQKTEALRSLLDDENAGASSIKAALEALRQARTKARQDLEAAQKDLRQVCSMKQEAQLVLMGVLD